VESTMRACHDRGGQWRAGAHARWRAGEEEVLMSLEPGGVRRARARGEGGVRKSTAGCCCTARQDGVRSAPARVPATLSRWPRA
jgi:hypothetical protein